MRPPERVRPWNLLAVVVASETETKAELYTQSHTERERRAGYSDRRIQKVEGADGDGRRPFPLLFASPLPFLSRFFDIVSSRRTRRQENFWAGKMVGSAQREREREREREVSCCYCCCCRTRNGAQQLGRGRRAIMLALHFPLPSSCPSLPVGRGCGPGVGNGAGAAAGLGEQWRPRIRGRARRGEQVDVSRPSNSAVAAAASAASSARASREEGYDKGTVVLEEGARPPQDMAAPLPPALSPDLIPLHVAVIMDGNSRWARERGLPTSAGHEAGYRALREILRLSGSWGVKVLTVFAFSSENWLRPKTEVDFLMTLFETTIRENLDDFNRQGIRLCIIGDSSKLPKSLQELSKQAAEVTKGNSLIELIVAVSYSGRSDIVQACQKIAQRVRDGELAPADITESVIEEELETNCTINDPYPDLLIRTSGELRLSNFLLWQSAYSELYFSNSLWPDFGEAQYIEALSSFQQRRRRYGKRI